MKRYLVYHTLPAGLTIEQIREVGRETQKTPGLRGLHSYLNLTDRAAVCVFEADSLDKVTRFFKDRDVPVDRIISVEWEGEGGVFREVRTPETATV